MQDTSKVWPAKLGRVDQARQRTLGVRGCAVSLEKVAIYVRGDLFTLFCDIGGDPDIKVRVWLGFVFLKLPLLEAVAAEDWGMFNCGKVRDADLVE